MRYILDTKTYVTEAGNRMSRDEIMLRGFDMEAEERAWPTVKITQSVSNTGDWFATEYEQQSHLGPRPKFGEVRTIEALEQIIDEQAAPPPPAKHINVTEE